MVSHRRRQGRRVPALTAFAATAVLLGVAGLTAAPAGATPVIPNGPSSSAAALSPGLYVQVVDGMIRVANGGGSQLFGAGQFGFLPSTTVPPVVVPTNPGLVFAPPPSFLPPAAQSAAASAAEAAATASATARALAQTAESTRGTADAARARADTAASSSTAAAAAQQAARDAKDLADQGLQYSQEQLADAQAALDALATDSPGYDDAVAAVAQAEAAVAAADERVTTTGNALEAAIAAASTAADAASTAADDFTAASAAAEAAAQRAAEAAGAARDLVRTTPAAVPPAVPSPTEGTTPTVPISSGQDIILLAAGFQPGTPVAFGIYSSPLAVAPVTVDPQGFAAASFQVPASFSGAHSLVAVGAGTDGLQRILRLDLTVTAAATPVGVTSTSTAALAATGVDATGPALLAAGALVIGAALAVVAGSRRRRRAA